MKKKLLHWFKMIFNWRYNKLYTQYPSLYRHLFKDEWGAQGEEVVVPTDGIQGNAGAWFGDGQ